MQLTFQTTSPLQAKADVLVLPVFKTGKTLNAGWLSKLDKALSGALLKAAKKVDFKAGADASFLFQTWEGFAFDRVILWGLGEAEDLCPESLWASATKIARKVSKIKGVKTAAIAWPALPKKASVEAGEAMLETLAKGFGTGVYTFDEYKTEDKGKTGLTKMLFFAEDAGASQAKAKQALARGMGLAEGINMARDLVNHPANTITPEGLANEAKKLGKFSGITVKVETEQAIAKRNMHLYLAVSRASKNRPRLITLTYTPPKGTKLAKKDPIVLIGKGLVFDSGGLCLKPGASMETMKCDMGGSAAVLGLFKALEVLKPARKIIGIIAACENAIGGDAYRPGDVIPSKSGKTVEIINTDAEGRLTLADALSYGLEFKPEFMVDLATLTGACVVGLGDTTVGTFANRDDLRQRVLDAAETAGEDFWPLPLNKKLRPQLKSDFADLKHTGARWGGAITAALFLQEFVDDTPWIHLDIAGPAYSSKNQGHLPKNGTGVGVATLAELVR